MDEKLILKESSRLGLQFRTRLVNTWSGLIERTGGGGGISRWVNA